MKYYRILVIEQKMDIAYLVSVIGGFLGIFLLVLTYTYIDKLEKIGCVCSEHPYRNFIKKYCIFAIVFIALVMFFPPATAAKYLGVELGTVYMFVKMAYGIATVVFFVLALIYVRYLMREKCKCSEDVRREVLYIWAILEIVILAAAVVIPLMIVISAGAFLLVKNTIKKGTSSIDTIMDAAINPIGNVKKIPGNVKKVTKSLRLSK